MYRALTKPSVLREWDSKLNNVNLGDILGILRYIQQEVIVEHVIADPDRKARKYDIDSIAKFDVTYQNPEGLTPAGVPGFGHSGAYDFGCMTTPVVLEEVARVGDYVGASRLYSPEIRAFHEWYWFAVTGTCPNLPWGCIKPFKGCHKDEADRPTIPAPCIEKGCAGKAGGQECAANLQDDDSKRSCCLHYANSEEVVKGGQCNETFEEPTGEHGCVFKVSPVMDTNYVLLDEIVGITALQCTSHSSGQLRNCKNWIDWRNNCHDPQGLYKRKFTCDGSCHDDDKPKIEPTEQCIEYDLHPFCQDRAPEHCGSEKCLALKPEERELGLPFWKGKCDAAENHRRAEAFAGLFFGDAVHDKHRVTNPSVIKSNPPCSSEDMCKPNSNGGPYCTRSFAGVCTPCYIPGTDPPFHAPEHTSVCPWSVLDEPGVAHHIDTKCESKLPRDLCCLYGIPGQECQEFDGHFPDVPLTLDGYVSVASKEDTAGMVTFLRRLVEDRGDEVGKDKDEDFRKLAYSAWAMQPPVRPSEVPWKQQLQEGWEAVQAKLATDPSVEKKTTTLTTGTTTTGTTTTITVQGTTTLTTTTVTITGESTITSTTSTSTPGAPTPTNFVKVFGIVVLLVAAIGGFFLLAYQQFCRQPAAAVRQARESRPVEAELSRM